MGIKDAINRIQDEDIVGLGGNVLHRAPMALIRELVRQNKKGLRVVKTAGALDIDLLCLGGCVASVDAGFVSYESEFGLANHYRKAVEAGKVKANEHACYTVIQALRASGYGVPFMPVRGLSEGDLITANDYFTRIKDPFGEEEITVVKAITPDVVLLHVQEADVDGNIRIKGPLFEDILLAKAAKKVIVSTEKIIPSALLQRGEHKAQLPGFLVDAVVHMPNGSRPCSCYGCYDIDREQLKQFKAMKEENELSNYLLSQEKIDRRESGGVLSYK